MMIRIRTYRSRSKWGCMRRTYNPKLPKGWQFVSRSSTSGKMFTNGTNLDVDSMDHEQCMQSELDPLIQRDEKGPTKKEERVARAQFLALCWALFVVGWTDGSTGPLLPRIQVFYDVS